MNGRRPDLRRHRIAQVSATVDSAVRLRQSRAVAALEGLVGNGC